MKKRALTAMTLACFAILVTPAGVQTAPQGTKLRVLLTYGGHGFQEKEFFAMWDALPDVTYTKAPLPQSADLFRPGLEKDYDVIVLYDMVKSLSPSQREGLLALLQKGIGVVSLHHNLVANLDWEEYHKVIGGTWVGSKRTIDGIEYGPSIPEHGQEIPVQIADKDHPITKGLSDFVLHDETYGKTYVSPSVHVLLTTTNPKNIPAFAWTNQYGMSRIVYFQAGHDAEAWKNPNFQEILLRSIRWTARSH
jgi:type 1 glutamine amidotransferase